jgi:hypothetical protein
MPLTVPLTPARRAILVAGVPAALALIALATWGWGKAAANTLAHGDQVGYSVKFSAPVSGGSSRLTVGNADVTLAPGPGRLIRGHGRLFGSIVRPVFQHRDTTRGLVLNPSCVVEAGICSLNLHVVVPSGRPVIATDNFGNLSATDLTGGETLTDNFGDLTVANLGGGISLSDQFGEVNATGRTGGVRITSTNGDITAAGVTGNTRLQGSFGAITVTGLAAADVVARDNSGEIRLVFSKVPQSVDVTDSFGSVTLVLPQGPTAYRVDAPPPPFGSRTVTVPESPTSRNVITVHTTNGDIRITNG